MTLSGVSLKLREILFNFDWSVKCSFKSVDFDFKSLVLFPYVVSLFEFLNMSLKVSVFFDKLGRIFPIDVRKFLKHGEHFLEVLVELHFVNLVHLPVRVCGVL